MNQSDALAGIRDVFTAARAVNLTGRLYAPDDPTQRACLNELVRCDLVLIVPATPTSVGGYVAHGMLGLASADSARRARA